MTHLRHLFSFPGVLAVLVCLFVGLAPRLQADDKVYRLGVNDVLDILVYGEEDLTRAIQIAEDGTITFPLIGRIVMAGLSIREAETKLAERLGENFLVDPSISIRIKEYRSRNVYVLGAVKKPGYYELRGTTTLLEILSRAGGVLPEGGKRLIVVKNDKSGDPSTIGDTLEAETPGGAIVVDGFKLFQEGDTSQNLLLGDKDVVYVPKAKEVFVLGEVKKPGPVTFSKDLTLLQAIGQAGGATELAAMRRVQVVRIVSGKRESKKYNLNDLMDEKGQDVELLPDDVVVVPKRIF